MKHHQEKLYALLWIGDINEVIWCDTANNNRTAQIYLNKSLNIGNIYGHRNCNVLSIFIIVTFHNINNNFGRVLFFTVQHRS